MSSVSFASALIGAALPVSPNGSASSRGNDTGASFGTTLQNMADKANAATSAGKTSVHDAPKTPDKSSSDASAKADKPADSKTADNTDQPAKAGKPGDGTKTGDSKGADAEAAAKAQAQVQAQLQAQAQANAAASQGTTLADLADAAADATPPDAATTADDTSTTGTGSSHKSGDAKSAHDALQDALAALTNAQGAPVQINPAVTNVNLGTGGTPSAGTGKDSRGTGLDDPKSGALSTDASVGAGAAPASQDLAALANAQAAAGTQTDDSATAYKQASDAAAAHASALQAAAGAAGSSNVQGSVAAATSAAIAPHVGAAGWDDAFSQKVVFLSNAHQQSAELTLNPKDLGPLQVVLQVTDNNAHALFVSQHAQVREAVEAALPKLREAMQASGIGLGSTSVSDGFARQSNQQSGDQRQGSGNRSGSSFGALGGVDDIDTTSTVSVPVRRTVGIVDTFA
jgi:flagellar hook-length control protein FliK